MSKAPAAAEELHRVFKILSDPTRVRILARNFDTPPDLIEDPFTGSAMGGMGCYLWHYGVIPEPVFEAEQGLWLERPGRAYGEVIGPPEDIVTVRVTNTTGELISVSYTFARAGAANLGTVPRGGENVEFSFPWEPGRLEFIVDQPRGVVTSNGVSSRRGDTFDLQVSRRQARATRINPSG